jgi:signal transduction histidine kinase
MWITLNRLSSDARTMAHMVTAGGTQHMPPGQARRAATMSTALATGVAVLTVLMSALAGRVGDDPLAFAERRLPVWLTAVGVAVVGVVVAGLWATRADHPRASIGLAVASAGSLLPLWAAWSWLPDVVRAGVLAATPFVVVGMAQVGLGWSVPGPRKASAAMHVVFALVVGGALGHLLGYDPFADPGCARTCEDVTPLLGGLISTRSAVTIAGLLTAVAAFLAVVVVFRESDPRTPRLIVGAVLVALSAQVVSPIVRLATWGDSTAAGLLLVLQPVAIALVAAAVCMGVARTLRTRSAVDRLAARLSGPVAALDGVHGVQFAIPGEARWVDTAGRDAPEVPGHTRYVVLSDESGPVLRLLVARGTDEGDVLTAVTPAARLALQNAQLSAVAKARLADVQASQRRVVATSDAERRRIERDLHDGAQQRLVSVAFHLKLALAGTDPPTAAQLATTENRVRDALAHLRRLAHGIFPNVLAEEGLAVALDELVAASDMPTRLDVRSRIDVGAEPAMAAYATAVAVLASVEHPALDSRALISIDHEDDTLTVRAEVVAGGGAVVAADFVDIADRVGALGGQLTRSETATDATVVTAVIPCGS